MTQAVVFDLFGVILTDALEAIVQEHSRTDPVGARRIVALVTAANRGDIEADTSRAGVAAVLGITPAEYRLRIRNGEVKNNELLAFISSLRQRYKTGLLTNILQGGLAVRFSPGELAAYFDDVVASCDIGHGKPEKEAYEISAARLGVPIGDCVLIDDRANYCEGAIEAGMPALLYTGFERMKDELASRYGVAADAE